MASKYIIVSGMGTTVIALGGNALLSRDEKPSFQNMLKNVKRSVLQFSELFESNERIVITHGNGPQVGEELLREKYASGEVPKLPFYVSNAVTQAQIGTALEIEIRSLLKKMGSDREVVTILTHVLVDYKNVKPTKQIGPYYTREELGRELRKEKFSYVMEKGRYRKVVASPIPRRVLEEKLIKEMARNGAIVIACGGGGIPVVLDGKSYRGVEGVIDKDMASQVLANSIGAKRLFILTDVDYVYLKYPKGAIAKSTPAKMLELLPSFEQGTIRPKVESCIEFVTNGGSEAHIGNLFKFDSLFSGGGTIIRGR
jgi:carbamate kinase